MRWTWEVKPREINAEAPLHSSVFERFAAEDGVLHYGLRAPYRPANLSAHANLEKFYEGTPPPKGTLLPPVPI